VFFARKAEIYALQRMNLSKFIDSDSQIMSRAFLVMSVLINRLANLWFNKKVANSKTDFTVPTKSVAKFWWTVFDKLEAKNGK
jgi:hypothetical protein